MLSELRKRRNMSQEDLASAMGTSQPMVSYLETNPEKILKASFSMVIRYSDALGISLDDLRKYLTDDK